MDKRLRIPIIISILLLVLGIVLTYGIVPESDADALPIIPGNSKTDWTIAVLIPYIFCFVGILIAPFLSLGLFFLHKKIKLNKYDYFITPIEKELSAARIILRALFPGLLAVNIAMYITMYGEFNQYFAEPENINSIPVLIEMIALIIGAPIACIAFTPIWALQTSGLMCRKNIEKYSYPVTPDIESVAAFYTKLLKGYVGISTIASYSLVLFESFQANDELSTYLVFFIDPILIMVMLVPLSTLFELSLNLIKKQLIKRYEKMGIEVQPKKVKLESI